MSFFDALSDGDRAELGYGPAGDPSAFHVLMHQRREAQALQRQVAQHGAGYVPASMAGLQPQGGAPAAPPPTAPAAPGGGAAPPDGYSRCEVLVPAAARGVPRDRSKEAEPTRRLREAMGLARKRRGTAAQPGAAAPVRQSATAPSAGPAMPASLLQM